jgi:hypothetical protein
VSREQPVNTHWGGRLSLPLEKSPHQSPHMVMPPHHIRSYRQISPMNVRNASEGSSRAETSGGSMVSDRHVSTDDQHKPGQYEIRLKGHLAARWADWFDGMSLVHESDGTTIIHGPVVDQAALHGLLHRVRDLGIPLISIIRIEPDQPDAPATERR